MLSSHWQVLYAEENFLFAARGRCFVCCLARWNRYVCAYFIGNAYFTAEDMFNWRHTYFDMYIKTEPMMFYFHSSLSLFLPVSAQGFEYNDIYVTAQLQLPECKLMIANTASQCLLLLLPCLCCVVCVVASLGGQWRPRVVRCDTNLQNKVKTLGKSVKSRCSSFDLCLACTLPRCWHIPWSLLLLCFSTMLPTSTVRLSTISSTTTLQP